MIKLTVLLTLLALAGCSHSERRPAASANDAVTPSEEESRNRLGEPVSRTPSNDDDVNAVPQTVPDSSAPRSDIDSPLPPSSVAPEPVAAVTPLDQGNSDSDLSITQQIRQSVMDDGSLSFNAKNVKIITSKGKVTLRGSVNNAQERATIETRAMRIAGSGRVDNQLEVQR